MKSVIKSLLLLLFAFTLFFESLVLIYLAVIYLSLLVIAKFSIFLAIGLITLAILNLTKVFFEKKAKEEG
jgi:hypothetical protein